MIINVLISCAFVRETQAMSEISRKVRDIKESQGMLERSGMSRKVSKVSESQGYKILSEKICESQNFDSVLKFMIFSRICLLEIIIISNY